MKAVLSIFLLCTLLSGCDKYTEKLHETSSCNFVDFYYAGDTTISLGPISNHYLVVAFDSNATESQIRNFIAADKEFDPSYQFKLYADKVTTLKFAQPKTCEEITATIARLQKNALVAFAHYTMQTNDCSDHVGNTMGNLCVNSYSNHFYVKVKNENDITDLAKLIKLTNTEMVQQNGFMSKWFTVKTTKHSKGDAMQMANYFKESTLFDFAEPNPWKLTVE